MSRCNGERKARAAAWEGGDVATVSPQEGGDPVCSEDS